MNSIYQWNTLVLGLIVVAVTVALAVGGLALARRYFLPHIKYEDVNDAISGALGAPLAFSTAYVWTYRH